jgi:TPP-dependent pyruvate/acetoin dehydrogenase alpha subunit
MHLNDDENGIIASIPIVGSNIPLAVGSALSDKINNSNTILMKLPIH